jgi:hypothetical protein
MSDQSLANRLNKSDQEKTAAFVRGLPPHLRMPIVQKDPKSSEEATRCTRLSQEAFMVALCLFVSFTSAVEANVWAPSL